MSPELPPDQFFFAQLSNYWLILAIKAACELGLPDYFNNGPVSVEEVATAGALDPDATFRLLRALADCGVFQQIGPATFTHTDRSQLLRSDLQQSFKWMVLSEFGEERVPAWMNLPEAVRSGETAWKRVHDSKDVWAYYREHPQKGEYFSRWMTGCSYAMIDAIHQTLDFSPYRTVVDVGGGQGAFLRSIVDRNPACRGVLFDLPEVIKTAPDHPRMERVPGDFFASSVPEGGDLYTLKWVIHDWEANEAIQILKNVCKAMKPGAHLMVIEAVVGEDKKGLSDMAKWMDLNMMVMTGGRERTELEHRSLLTSAGLRLDRIIPTASLPRVLLATVA